MRKESIALWLLFIYSLAAALKITIVPVKVMKELSSDKAAETLFLELMKLENGSRSGFSILAHLLKSETTPFRRQYLKFCETFTIFAFLGIQKHSRKFRNLDIKEIISPDCISASKIRFYMSENQLYSFFKRRGSHPIMAKNYRPTQWSDEIFGISIREALLMNLKPDWTSWCGDVNIEGKHFSQELWNSYDKLWRLLNFNCINRMTKSNRIMLRARFVSIFRANQDSAREALMKIISLAAAFQTLNNLGAEIPKENPAIKTHMEMLLDYIRSMKEGPASILFTSSKLIRSCGFETHDANSLTMPSPRKILIEIVYFLKDEPAINSSWLLNLIYLALHNPHFMASESALNRIINWFFSLQPSVSNICQLLDIINGTKKPILMVSTIFKIGPDSKLISEVYRECPMLCKSMTVPFETRLRHLLAHERTFPRHILNLKIPSSKMNDFSFLVSVILEHEQLIFTQNHAVFEVGFLYFDFKSLEAFFIHFLKAFLGQPELYLFIGYEKRLRLPVIVPSLKTPKRVIYILTSILTRAFVLNFKVPYCLHSEYFYAAVGSNIFEQFSKVLRIKRLFFNAKRMPHDTDLLECDRVNRNERDIDMLLDYLSSINSRSPIKTEISGSILINLIEAQLRSVSAAVVNVFKPNFALFKPQDIYNLIFK